MSKEDARTALVEKYTQMLAMRRAREQLEAQGILRFSGEAATDRKKSSRELASRFPGALKELDLQSADALEKKLAALKGCPADDSLPLWAQISYDYHKLLKQALAMKAWLAEKRKELLTGDAVLLEFLAQEKSLYELEDWPSSLDGKRLMDRIASPPQGRLSHLVWEVLEERFGLSMRKMQALAFGLDDD